MKKIGPKMEPWGTPQVRSEGEDFFFSFTVTTCILQVGTEEGQGKITNTKSASEACQKNAMIDRLEGSAQIQKSQNRDRPRIRSSQEVIKDTKESCLGTISGNKLIGRCAKDCCGRDDGKVGQEQVSQ